MIDLSTPIVPYVGTGIFKLYSSLSEIETILKQNEISYEKEKLPPTDIDPPWIILVIKKDGSPRQHSIFELFFANDSLFKICLCEDFDGTLPNRIHTGMNLKKALQIDPKLQRDDDCNEIFISPDGYSIEYSNRTLDVIIISIFTSEFEAI